MTTSISLVVRDCLEKYDRILERLRGFSSRHSVPRIEVFWDDELGRLRIWSANIGAHQIGHSSLDYRLRDASHIRQQILELLEDLLHTIEEAEDLTAKDDKLSTLSNDSGSSVQEDSVTELFSLHEVVVGIVDCLHRMSILVCRPTQHDILIDRDSQNIARFEPHDIEHTRDQFPNADPKLINILGAAITQRRKLLDYRKRRIKVGGPLQLFEDQHFRYLDHDTLDELSSDAGVSQSPFDTMCSISLEDGEGITLPTPPKGSSNGKSFECPYCFCTIIVDGSKAWQEHVMEDILPYNCIIPECSFKSKLFSSRHAWYKHLQKLHEFRQTDLEDETSPVMSECPLCKESLVSSNKFERHVARHLQDLALYALPRSDLVDGPDEIQVSASTVPVYTLNNLLGTEVQSDSIEIVVFGDTEETEQLTNAKVDRGLPISIISRAMTERLRAKPKLTQKVLIKDSKGKAYTLIGEVDLLWHRRTATRTNPQTFFVVDLSGLVVILGANAISPDSSSYINPVGLKTQTDGKT